MSEREAKVYWVSRTGQKDLLIFDAGHKDGTIYVYEFKESVLAQDVMGKEKNVQS